MSLRTFYENNDGDVVEITNRLPADTLEVAINAVEGTVGASQITIRDTAGDFAVRAHKLLYFVETAALDDDWYGVIGPFYIGPNFKVRRDLERTGAARTYTLQLDDVNTLLTRRLQKGTDAERLGETDVARVQWLITTPEFSGSVPLVETIYLFTDTPQAMGESNYGGLDSANVLNDAMQDGRKNFYLYNAPDATDDIRLGLWYGVTDRTDFSSPHRISNYLSDIDPDTLTYFTENPVDLDYDTGYTFGPSIDAELDRDGSRIYSGGFMSFDGGNAYTERTDTADDYTRRDGTFIAELVKTRAQAIARLTKTLRDVRVPDDAITCSVLVPDNLIHAFAPGHRVEVRFSHLPGYEAAFVWMRVAAVTYRQISAGAGLYELALDLRGETPPETGTAGAPVASGVFAVLNRPATGGGSEANPGGAVYWGSNGDNPAPGYGERPTTGPLAILTDAARSTTPWPYYGIQVTDTGTLSRIEFNATVAGILIGPADHDITWAILHNGAVIASTTVNATRATFYEYYSNQVEVIATNVAVATGDVITAAVTVDPPMPYFRVPYGTGTLDERLEIIGGTFP